MNRNMPCSADTLSFQEWCSRYYRKETSRSVYLWGASTVVAAFLVGGALWWGLTHAELSPIVASPAPPPAIAVDMTPLPALAPSPTQDVPVGVQQQAAPQEAEPEKRPALDTPPAPAPHPPVPVPKKRVAVAHKKHHQHPQPHPVPPQEVKESKADQTTAPPAAEASSAAHAQAPSPHQNPSHQSTSPATWQGDIVARLEHFKRYPAKAQNTHQEGVSLLFFTIDRQGHVLQAHIQHESGFSLLDEETMALVHRAEPFPEPPDSIPGERISMTVPISFLMNEP